MKRKDKSSEERFGHVNAINRKSYLNIILIELVTQSVKKTKKTKIRFLHTKKLKNLGSTALLMFSMYNYRTTEWS